MCDQSRLRWSVALIGGLNLALLPPKRTWSLQTLLNRTGVFVLLDYKKSCAASWRGQLNQMRMIDRRG